MVVIDCRTIEEQEQCTLPNTCLLESEAYTDTDVMGEIPDRFISIRGSYHIILMGSNKFKASNFDLEMEDRDSDEIDVVQNMMENLLLDFQQKGFQYVSVVDGGFAECHDLALSLSCELERHSESCLYCASGRNKPLRDRFEMIKGKVAGKVKTVVSGLKAFARRYSNKKGPVGPVLPLEQVMIASPLAEDRVCILKVYFTQKELEAWEQDPKTAFYQCKKYDKVLGSCYPEERVLVITRKEIVVSTPFKLSEEDSSSLVVGTVVESAPLDTLVKISSKKASHKILFFYFKQNDDESNFSYGFQRAEEANACVQRAQYLFRLLKSPESEPHS